MESQTGLCQLVQKGFLDTMHKLETREWAPMHGISQAPNNGSRPRKGHNAFNWV